MLNLDPEQYTACKETLPRYREALAREAEMFADLPPEELAALTASTRDMIAHLERCIAHYEATHPAAA